MTCNLQLKCWISYLGTYPQAHTVSGSRNNPPPPLTHRFCRGTLKVDMIRRTFLAASPPLPPLPYNNISPPLRGFSTTTNSPGHGESLPTSDTHTCTPRTRRPPTHLQGARLCGMHMHKKDAPLPPSASAYAMPFWDPTFIKSRRGCFSHAHLGRSFSSASLPRPCRASDEVDLDAGDASPVCSA